MGQREKKVAKVAKKKKPWSKARKIVFGSIMGFVVLILVVAGIFLGPVFGELVYPIISSAFRSSERIDVSMTEEERLEDLEYLYNVAYLGNSNKEEFQKLYDMDFEELYLAYQEYVKECQSDYEFFCVCLAFLKDMPSGHTGMSLPVWEILSGSGFELATECSMQKDEAKYLYSWGRVVEEGIKNSYDFEKANFTNFIYVDGKYIAGNLCDPEFTGMELISVNGISPDDYILDGMFYAAREYDDIYNKVYRSNIFFNDLYGEPVTIVCENIDGEEITLQLCTDFIFEASLEIDYNMKRVDIDYRKDGSTGAEYVVKKYSLAGTEEDSENDANENSGVYKGYSYEIVEDIEHNLVYWRVDDCDNMTEGSAMKEILDEVLTEYDTVILDLRNNGGGKVGYYSSFIYPVLFKDDEIMAQSHIEMPINDVTKRWGRAYWNKIYSDAKMDEKLGIITYTEGGGTMTGNGIKDYEVYVLINESTFSSADLISYQLSTHDNVTMVGTNTQGEGMEGSIFIWKLPNSRLTFSFTPGINRDLTPSDSVYGTAPDIKCIQSFEGYREKVRMKNAGENVNSYEARKRWDNVLCMVLELVG